MQGVRGRIDVVFNHPVSGKVRVTEVKSGNCIREVHRIQAALYWPFSHADEITVSNSENDEILSPTFIQNALERVAAAKTPYRVLKSRSRLLQSVMLRCWWLLLARSRPDLSRKMWLAKEVINNGGKRS